MKILEFIRYYSLRQLHLEHSSNHSMPFHQLWNWDYLANCGFEMEEIDPKPLIKNGILRQLFMDNLAQQREVQATPSDVIYAPFMGDAYYIALLKCIGLIKRPLIAISQDTWDPTMTNGFKNKFKYLFLRYIAKHGVDKLLFISRGVYDQCRDYFNNSQKHIPLNHWGVDIEYYDNYKVPCNPGNYIFVTGGANRDFSLLQQLGEISELSLPIFIQTNRCPESLVQTDKLTIDRSPQTWNDLLDGYKKAFAVAVPLEQRLSYLSGITVVLEGMACRKPILSTETNLYPINIEKERVGLYLPYNDVNAWKEAIQYLSNHPGEAQEMGERGRYIVEHRHNYNLFNQELVEHINSLYT